MDGRIHGDINPPMLRRGIVALSALILTSNPHKGDVLTDRPMDRQQTDRQTGRQTDRQTDN